MKSRKKIKAGQVDLPTLPTLEQKAAMDAASSPGADNPFLTKAESDASADFTDYNYNITGERAEQTPIMFLSQEYTPGSLKVYLNGMRLTRGNYYDYREGTGNMLVMNYPLDPEDLLVVDYRVAQII